MARKYVGTNRQVQAVRGLSEMVFGGPEFQAAIIADVEAALIAAVTDRRAMTRMLQVLGEDFRSQKIPPDQLRRAYTEVGRAAQRSVVQAFTHRKNRRSGVPPYRITPNLAKNKRYAGGALLRALQAPDFFRATPRGLDFINAGRLDQEARHWRRLNFGAGAVAGDPPQKFQVVSGSGLVIAAMGLEPDPRPAFILPRGYWVDVTTGLQNIEGAHGTSAFYPVGEYPPGVQGRGQPPIFTRGIVATNFLDAGVRRIAHELPRAFEGVAMRQLMNAGKRHHGTVGRYTVRSIR